MGLSLVTTAYYNQFHRNWYKLDRVGTDTLNLGGLGAALADPGRLGILRGESAGATVFHARFKDLYVPQSFAAGSTAADNGGDVRTWGVEFKTQYDVGKARGWGWSHPWYLVATYTDARLRGEANLSKGRTPDVCPIGMLDSVCDSDFGERLLLVEAI